MDTQAKLTAAQRLINVVCGEPYGDGDVVTDVGVGYAERGYHDDETVWVLGDWNDRARLHNDPPIPSDAPGRLFDALERIGVEGEWHDEWTKCSNCYRIVRDEPDSHGWKPFYVVLDDGDTLCGTCALDPEWTDDCMGVYINRSDRVVTWCDESYLTDNGWTRYNQDEYQSGWHPGMDDKSATVAARITEAMPDHDYLFWLDESSQFYLGFSAFTRPKATDDDDDWINDHDLRDDSGAS